MKRDRYGYHNLYVPNIDLLYFVRFIITDCLVEHDYKLIQNNQYPENTQNICSRINNRAYKEIKKRVINKHERHNLKKSTTTTTRRVYTKHTPINPNLERCDLFLNTGLSDILDVKLLSAEKKTLLLKTLKLNKTLNILRKTNENHVFENYSFFKTLGQGSYGKVFLVTSNHNKASFALKVIKTSISEENKKFFEYKINFETTFKFTLPYGYPPKLENDPNGNAASPKHANEQPSKERQGIRLYVLREIYMMMLIKYLSERWSQKRDQNTDTGVTQGNCFVKPCRILWSPNFIYMVMPAYNCNLREYLNNHFKSGVHIHVIKPIVKRLLSILYMLHHEFRIVHRDIKPENVLISHKCLIDQNGATTNRDVMGTPEVKELVLGDFGLSRVIPNPHTTTNLTINVVTLNYKPPELLLNYKYYDFSVDIWGIGCILYELITGRQLFNEHNEFNLLLKIFNRIRFPLKQEWSNISSIPYLNLSMNGHESIFKSLSESCDKRLVNLLSRFDTINR